MRLKQTIRKFTAIQLGTNVINQEVKIDLSYGEICGPYYDQTNPTEIFDSEEEAIEYAYENDKYARWLILPVITFET